MACHLPGGVDDLLHGEAHAVAQVKMLLSPPLFRYSMAKMWAWARSVDVDVVPHAGAVPGVVVVAVDGHLLPLAQGHLEDQGDEMGLGVVGLANLAGLVGAAGVKVPQAHIAQAVGLAHPVEHPLHRELCLAVGVVGWVGSPSKMGMFSGSP